jgi:hypothetical protein
MTKQSREITERAFLDGEALAYQGLDNRSYVASYKCDQCFWSDKCFGDKVLTIRNAAKRIVKQHPYPEHDAISFLRRLYARG